MLYVITAIDRPGQPERRQGARDAHLAHLAEKSSMIRSAGPFLTESGDPCGSMLVIEAESLASAQAFMDQDPYGPAGVFESVTIRPWRLTLGAGLEAKEL